MKRLSSTLFALFTLSYFTGMAQVISGKVTDTTGHGVSFAIAALKNAAKAVASDVNGNFKIIPNKLPCVLVVSSVGYNTKELPVNTTKDTFVTVVLTASTVKLSDIVVVAYGVQKKKDITGSVASIKFDRRRDGVDASPELVADKASAYKASDYLREYATPPVVTVIGDSAGIADAQKYRVKQLTGGELNDFAKWKMWTDFSASEFSMHSRSWHLSVTQRYCVQLQNQQHIAVVNRPVWLVSTATNDTVWQAVTDNTGKAELWANFDGKKTGDEYVITCDGCGVYRHPSQFANGINRLTLQAPCTVSDKVDIAFVVDATGSMGDEIGYLKTELENIIDKSSPVLSGTSLNAAAVFYRDNGDAYLTRYTGFDNSLTATYNFIKQQSASGGGDIPEAVDDALRVAIDSLSWRGDARTRLLFLVLDAPPHDEARDKMLVLIKRAAQKGIRVIPIVCSGADKSTEFMMRSIALATNGTYVFLTDDSGIGETHLKPTTDTYTVELLTNLLQRLIKQMVFVNACDNNAAAIEPVVNNLANKLAVKAYPNPTSGMVTLSSSKPVKEMFVADFTGKILARIKSGVNNTRVNLSNYPNGTYLIKYVTEEGEWGAEKIILLH